MCVFVCVSDIISHRILSALQSAMRAPGSLGRKKEKRKTHQNPSGVGSLRAGAFDSEAPATAPRRKRVRQPGVASVAPLMFTDSHLEPPLGRGPLDGDTAEMLPHKSPLFRVTAESSAGKHPTLSSEPPPTDEGPAVTPRQTRRRTTALNQVLFLSSFFPSPRAGDHIKRMPEHRGFRNEPRPSRQPPC